jgi:VRR-NUC domain-containing protein
MTESEGNIKRAIRDYLELKRCVVVPVRNVGIRKADGSYIPLPAGDRGMSDMIVCLPDGRFAAIEVKKKGNKPTQEQLQFLEAVHRANGIGIVAYSLDDVMKLL